MFSLNGTLKKSGSVGRWETKQSIGMASALSGSLTPKSYDEHPRHVKYGSPPPPPKSCGSVANHFERGGGEGTEKQRKVPPT